MIVTSNTWRAARVSEGNAPIVYVAKANNQWAWVRKPNPWAFKKGDGRAGWGQSLMRLSLHAFLPDQISQAAIDEVVTAIGHPPELTGEPTNKPTGCRSCGQRLGRFKILKGVWHCELCNKPGPLVMRATRESKQHPAPTTTLQAGGAA